jgi:adenylate cyclase class IV
MGTNVEIKARVADLPELERRVARISDGPSELLRQEDTFFHVSSGRLKLRSEGPNRGELIYYERTGTRGPMQSDYHITPTTDPAGLAAVLAAAHGVRGVVRKKRQLYLAGNTRIHLDDVEGLGSFLELEVVLAPGQDRALGEARAAELMCKLGIEAADLIDVAYIDLLEASADREAGGARGANVRA